MVENNPSNVSSSFDMDFINNYDIKYRMGGAEAMADDPSRLVGTRRDAASTLGAATAMRRKVEL